MGYWDPNTSSQQVVKERKIRKTVIFGDPDEADFRIEFTVFQRMTVDGLAFDSPDEILTTTYQDCLAGTDTTTRANQIKNGSKGLARLLKV